MARLFDFLPGEGAAYSFIVEAVSKGKELAELVVDLKANGIEIRNPLLEQVYNYLSGPMENANKYIQSVNLNKFPSVARLVPSATAQLRNFSYKIAAKGKDLLTGEDTTRYFGVSSNALLTKQQAIDQITDIVDTGQSSEGFEAESMQVTGVTVNSAGLVPY